MAGNVPLHPIINRDDVKAANILLGRFNNGSVVRQIRESACPFGGFFGDDFTDKILPDEFRTSAGLLHEGLIIEIDGRKQPGHRSVHANPADQGPRVDAFHAHDAVLGQVIFQRLGRPIIAGMPAQLPAEEAPQREFPAFDIFGIDAVVSDERVRHGDDLAAVRRVGEDFLIPRHAGVEYNFSEDFARGPEGFPGEDGSITECKFGSRRHGCWQVGVKVGLTPARSASERKGARPRSCEEKHRYFKAGG